LNGNCPNTEDGIQRLLGFCLASFFLVRNQRFWTTYPNKSVPYQKKTLGKNPKAFIQHYNRGGSLQSRTKEAFSYAQQSDSVFQENWGRVVV
jgi:hypothetical protein